MTTYTHAIASIYGSISSRWNFKIKPYVLIALALVIFLVIQHYYNIHWGVLTELQKNGLYKQFTGILLFLLVAQQWQLAYVRLAGRKTGAGPLILSHKWRGVICPAFIFLHTAQMGYGHQFALWTAFIGTLLVGLFSFHEIKLRSKWFANAWTIVHVSLAVLLPPLMLYHAYISYVYS